MNPRLQTLLQISAILLLALALRIGGLDWDQGHLLHPDERFLSMVTADLEHPSSLREYFDTHVSPLNPANQDQSRYVYGTLPLFLTHAIASARDITDLSDIARLGRLLSALWSTGTVLLIFLIARRLGKPPFAVWMALLYTLTVLSIQQAHFYTVDTAGVFFSVLALGLGLTAARELRPRLLAPAGLAVGLAMACRLNLGLLAIWLSLVALSLLLRRNQPAAIAWLCLGGLLAALAFRIAQPYAFDASGFLPRGINPQWLDVLEEEYAITHGQLEVPYTLQWVGRIPYLYALHQLAAWGMGWPLGLAALLGAASLLWHLRRDPGHWAALLALWPLLLIAYHARIHLHTLRYFLPAYPALILCAGLAIRRLQPRELRLILASILTTGALLHALAFHNIYRQTHPRIQASAWLLHNLPDGGTVTFEHWDDPLPLRLPGHEDTHANIETIPLHVYDPESPEKLEQILQAIDRADYVVLSSTRASDSIPRLSLRYPVTTHFYDRLLTERLGLERVARFHTPPALGGWALDSLRAEEAFRVYDHPLVRIYQKTPVWQIDVIRDLLLEDVHFDRIPDIRYPHAGRWNNGWLTPAQLASRNTDVSHHQKFSPDSIGNRAPLLIWILALLLLGFAAFPITHTLFPALPDRGLFCARLLGLLLLSWLAWLPAALELLTFPHALVLAAAALLLLSATLFAFRTHEMLTWLRRNSRTLLFGETLFWAVFLLFLALRWHQPELWHPWAGGEKPMNLAFLNATAHSPHFPPQNPWLAGAFINYYYFGHVLLSTLIRITGISPEIAYNLALPTFAAFTAGAASSLAHAFHPLLRTRTGHRGARTASLLAVLLLLLLGNLGQLRWLLEGRPGHSRDGYWAASRVLRVPPGEVEPITEFPFFSHLYGDLHAHLMALPIVLLALLASWHLLRRLHPTGVLLSGFLLGTLWTVNAWDLPAQAALFIAALLLPLLRTPRALLLRTAWTRLGWSALGLAIARLAYAPFHWKTLSPPLQFEFWDGPRSSLLDLLLAHGVFLLPLALLIPLLLRGKPLRHAPRLHRLYALLPLLGALALILLVEFIRLQSDIGRMNTVFKFYIQVWWILSIATGLVLSAASARLRTPRTRILYALALLPLLLGALYPFTALPAKLRDRVWPAPRGLDGFAHLRGDHTWHTPDDNHPIPISEDLPAIQWLRQHAAPSDVLLEAVRPQYQWGARISWHTGNPTVLGWPWHMIQQRPHPRADQPIHQRTNDVQTFYTTSDPREALRIARLHRVRYVILGQLERHTYGDSAQTLLDNHPAFSLVHPAPTRIYKIHSP